MRLILIFVNFGAVFFYDIWVFRNVEHGSHLLSTLQLSEFPVDSEDSDKPVVDSNTVGGYSELFYGPNGARLLQKRPLLPTYDRLLPPYPRAVTTDIHTGEQRYLLRTDLVATALSQVGVEYNSYSQQEEEHSLQRHPCIRRYPDAFEDSYSRTHNKIFRE